MHRCGHFLSVSYKPQLKYFKANKSVMSWRKLKLIDAPNLHTPSYGTVNNACAIDISDRSSVKELELSHAMLMQLDYFLSKFLSLEVLMLNSGTTDKFKISSQGLKRLVLGLKLQITNFRVSLNVFDF